MPVSPLKPYQKKAVRFARDHPYCGLFLDMGLGKTLSSIALMDICKKHGEQLHWLVIMPAQLIRQRTWERELDKWAAMHRLTSQSLDQPPRKRLAACQRPDMPDITFVSNASLQWLDDNVRDWPWNAMIIDELSGYRNTKSQRFRILRRRRRTMRRIVGLTGTPVPKSLDNLWGEIYLLDGGDALGSSITRYRSRWFHEGAKNWQTGVVYNWEPDPGAFDAIMERLQPFCLSMSRRDERPDIPDPVIDERHLDMPVESRRIYNQLTTDMTVDLRPGEITASNAGVLTNRLSQITAGFLYPNRENLTPFQLLSDPPRPRDHRTPRKPWAGVEVVELTIANWDPSLIDHPELWDDERLSDHVDVDARLGDGRIIRLDPDCYQTSIRSGVVRIRPEPWVWDRAVRDLDMVKLDAVTQLVEELDGEPLLVFYRYRRELARLRERFGRSLHTLDEPDAQDQWNRGRIPILALQPASSQYGLNLQDGGHHVCWTSLTWDLEQWAQANARLNRSGQKHTVVIHTLLMDDTVDPRMISVLRGRETLQNAVMETLKPIL